MGGETFSYKYTYNNNLEKVLTKIEYPNTTHTIEYNGFGNIEKQTTTKEDSLMVYHYNEENGFGFLEFVPEEESLYQVGEWNQTSVQKSNFCSCDSWIIT